jgi:hypothetical protein
MTSESFASIGSRGGEKGSVTDGESVPDRFSPGVVICSRHVMSVDTREGSGSVVLTSGRHVTRKGLFIVGLAVPIVGCLASLAGDTVGSLGLPFAGALSFILLMLESFETPTGGIETRRTAIEIDRAARSVRIGEQRYDADAVDLVLVHTVIRNAQDFALYLVLPETTLFVQRFREAEEAEQSAREVARALGKPKPKTAESPGLRLPIATWLAIIAVPAAMAIASIQLVRAIESGLVRALAVFLVFVALHHVGRMLATATARSAHLRVAAALRDTARG